MSNYSNAVAATEEAPFSMKAIMGPLMAIVVGMIMVILDSTVMNIALPTLMDDFKSSVNTMQWSITAYTLALSAVIPLAGWLTDRFGAKQIFLITIFLFAAGSLLCSFATTPEQLIAYRVIQGIGGGMVQPIGMAIIFKLAPPNKQGAVMGMLGIPMMLGPALGPVLGGYLLEYATWHWIFLINLPIGIIAILVGLKYLPRVERKTVPELDIWGMFLAPIAFATLSYAVSEGGKDWGSTKTIVGLIVGFVALVLFIIVELRHKQPLLELRAFKSPDFTIGMVTSWLMFMALFGSFLFVPMYMQQVFHYEPLKTGFMILPQVAMTGLFMPIGGKLFDKFGARAVCVVGVAFVAAGMFYMSQIQADSGSGFVIIATMIMGVGMGLSMMPVNTHILKAAPRHLVGRVTPLTSAAQQVVVSFAVAGLASYLSTRMTDHMTTSKGDAAVSLVAAFGDTFFIAGCIATAGALLAILLRKPKAVEGEATDQVNAPVMMH
ncbi:DHA2 family efflux MFS transporter permease subunit [Paenibacillus sp. CF384]|uniref:DHA2 family efflux MFS transporter permease subunit n=1 Tax=Paenibacillus sp. CF384 TaxID=1884382 RepID=UPI00089C8390|nr:DHA2 family efflux MFS transporter permease subunit [Paenibacillus sp. CF384]SDX55636.1 drug resistance transporter, EmrB/QacA subfamily [Paenibacillus sp. CF384]